MFTGTWNNRIECFYKSNIFDPLFGSTFHNKTKRAFKKKSEKSRKKNFSTDETRVLREMWEKDRDYLCSAFTNTVTNSGKTKIWRKITDAINSLGHEERTVEEVRHKWKNMSHE